MNKIELSIIIVNYMKYELTQQCIDSVTKHLRNITYEIIVLDNNSSNNSFIKLTEMYQEVSNISIYKNEANNGFGAGNNLAVRYAQSEYVLFLNPDVILIDDSVSSMIRSIGIVGSQLLNADYSLQYSCRRFLPFIEFILARTPLKNVITKTKAIELNKM